MAFALHWRKPNINRNPCSCKFATLPRHARDPTAQRWASQRSSTPSTLVPCFLATLTSGACGLTLLVWLRCGLWPNSGDQTEVPPADFGPSGMVHHHYRRTPSTAMCTRQPCGNHSGWKLQCHRLFPEACARHEPSQDMQETAPGLVQTLLFWFQVLLHPQPLLSNCWAGRHHTGL